VRFEMNPNALREILRSDEVLGDLRRRGEAVAAAAGPGHRVETETGPNRARVAVITDTIPAMIAEARDRRLTRAIDAARG